MRSLFLLDPDVVFLNHGSFGACPVEVLEVQQRWQREMERNPVEFLGRRSGALLATSRARLAAYLGARAEDLIYLTNATTGVNTVARSLDLRAGDEILTTDHEYGACDAAWEFACQRSGARYVRAQVPLPFVAAEFADRILAAVTPRTRLVFASHIASTTGLIFPVQELCRRARGRGILTMIDGAHAPGHIPLELDTLGADFYAGNCHKWLCAPKGAGFLHVRPEHHARLDAVVVSWGYCAEPELPMGVRSESGELAAMVGVRRGEDPSRIPCDTSQGPSAEYARQSGEIAAHSRSLTGSSGAIEGHTGFDAYTGSTVLERRHQWQGTRDISAFLAVPAAIDFQERHHWREVRRACHALLLETRDRLGALTGLGAICAADDFGQMLAIALPPCDPETLRAGLFERYRIEVPITTHRGRQFVRVALQGYNTRADVDALIAALVHELGLP